MSAPTLPPGPPPLPIIGNLHLLLGTLPHRSFQKLSQKYGPIMSFRLGSIPTVVISSPEAAELFLKTHGAVFASRPKLQVTDHLSYGGKGVGFTEYGPYWRSVRKLCTVELLSPAKLDAYVDVRKEEMAVFVEEIKSAAAAGEAVDVTERVHRVIEYMTYRMAFGRRIDESAVDLMDAIREVVELVGAFNLSDYFPLLRAFDVQGLVRSAKRVGKKIDKIFERIIDELEEEEVRADQTPQSHFIHILLACTKKLPITQNDLSISIDRDSIKAILLDVIVAATDTLEIAIEWIMTELMRHPRVMKKVQEEINRVVGKDRMVDENDLSKFKYLEMVIKESLRLHPVAPLLVPHQSTEDVVVNEYLIPKNSMILVNVRALGRDPNVWSENSDEFIPERFVDSEIDLKGRHLQLIPFGTGRRGCPGMSLAMITLRLVVAQLVHCFDWELPNGLSPSDLDMTEKFNVTLPRAVHLFAVPKYR